MTKPRRGRRAFLRGECNRYIVTHLWVGARLECQIAPPPLKRWGTRCIPVRVRHSLAQQVQGGGGHGGCAGADGAFFLWEVAAGVETGEALVAGFGGGDFFG